MRRLLFLLCLFPLTLHAQEALPTIEAHTEGFTKMDGFFPLYWDEAKGEAWIEVSRIDEDFLYLISLPAGLGSNDVGLDRGLLGNEYVARFERTGPQLLLVTPNLGYRASSDNALERRAVRDAFAEGVLWGFKIEAASGDRVLVKANDFMLRDAMGVSRRLKGTNQGTFSVDKSRSAPYLPAIKAFPQNTEMEARLTFTTNQPGAYVQSVAADPYAVTVRVRQSFIELPDGDYTPRAFDPRSGYYPLSYVDYATPIGSSKEKRYLRRHRLKKQDPSAEQGPAVEPIVYYLDPGTPEPIRSALLDGARWWNEAFEAAGFVDAYRVEMLPDDADPLDVRYNVIQWVHRSTRGWSYGRSVVDPRTGEIIKGHVTLGSLRVRQDYLIAEGLLAPYVDGEAPPSDEDPMLELALARLRQLSAHEVGHTLGLVHNFAASVNNRASVMDYPAPLALMAGSDVDLSEAYDTGIGEWDKISIRYGYTDFAPGTDEANALEAILEDARDDGLMFISDTDARPVGGAHPTAHLWDNGEEVVEALENQMAARQAALDRFGPEVLRNGQPMAMLEETLVPLYLGHRYQVEATVKVIGGVDYAYTVRGADERPVTPVSGDLQRSALAALLDVLSPEALRLPEEARTLIPPRPVGYGPTRELFDGHTGLTFDAYAPAGVVADVVLGFIAHPQRAARLVYQHDQDESLPNLEEVLRTITDDVLQSPMSQDEYEAELQRITQVSWVNTLFKLAAEPDNTSGVRAQTLVHLREIAEWLEEYVGRGRETFAHRAMLLDDIARFLDQDYDEMEPMTPLTVPPGSPIGQSWIDWLDTRMQACGM